MNADLLPMEVVSLAGDRLVTDTLRVAKHFGKHHRDVLRAVARLDCSQAFNQRNFARVVYTDAKGERRPLVEMTKDGFMFLAMGFTGHEAAVIKEAYIEAFNKMAEQLERRDLHLMRKLLDFEMRARVSGYRARYGSTLMNERRRELPRLRREEKELRIAAQPQLFQLVKGAAS